MALEDTGPKPAMVPVQNRVEALCGRHVQTASHVETGTVPPIVANATAALIVRRRPGERCAVP